MDATNQRNQPQDGRPDDQINQIIIQKDILEKMLAAPLFTCKTIISNVTFVVAKPRAGRSLVLTKHRPRYRIVKKKYNVNVKPSWYTNDMNPDMRPDV